MTDTITTALEAVSGITRADSWPTGTTNEGPEEYGINYDTSISTEEVLSELDTLLSNERGVGFHLEQSASHDYDLNASAHYHPLSDRLSDFFEHIDGVTAYGLDWSPDDIWGCYDGSPYMRLEEPGALEAWFEAEDNEYDVVLDSLEDRLPHWMYDCEALITLEVYNADSDHCHMGLTYEIEVSFDRVLDAFNLSPSPVFDEAGQQSATVYSAEWLSTDIFLTPNGIAHLGASGRKTQIETSTEFIKKIALDHLERRG